MDYFDTLRRYGWISDPADRVSVDTVHQADCPVDLGRQCDCEPRLVLREDESLDRNQNASIVPWIYGLASGE